MSLGMLSLICCLPLTVQPVEQSNNDFEGVWNITSIHDNGTEQKLEKQDSHAVNAWRHDEILVVKGRIVIVDVDGSSVVGKMKLLERGPQAKYEVTTGIYHDKSGEASYLIMKNIDGGLCVAWVPKAAAEIDDSAGADQIVIRCNR